MNIIEYKRPLSGKMDKGEWWEQFTELLSQLGTKKSDAVALGNTSFDYEYGSIKGAQKETDVYIDDSEEEEIFLAGFPKRLLTDLSYVLEESVPELAQAEKVTASLAEIKRVPNGILITISWKVSNDWKRKERS